jgi:uncharacterized membrane protein YccF (DUF307 family)
VRLILNVIWLVLCGIWLAIAYVLAGIVACILIITIPFGIASFRIASYVLWPFGRTTVPRQDAGIPLGLANFKLIPISLLPLGIRIVDSDEVGATYTA